LLKIKCPNEYIAIQSLILIVFLSRTLNTLLRRRECHPRRHNNIEVVSRRRSPQGYD